MDLIHSMWEREGGVFLKVDPDLNKFKIKYLYSVYLYAMAVY